MQGNEKQYADLSADYFLKITQARNGSPSDLHKIESTILKRFTCPDDNSTTHNGQMEGVPNCSSTEGLVNNMWLQS